MNNSIVLRRTILRKNHFRKNAGFPVLRANAAVKRLRNEFSLSGTAIPASMPGEPMQGPGNSGFRITSDLAKQIVHRQEKDRLWILLTFFYRPSLLHHRQSHFKLGQQ